MYKNIKKFPEFAKKVQMLWAPDYEDRELEEFPCTAFGGFRPSRVDALLRLARLHPEYHIAVCIEPGLYVNTFVKGALTYYLAEGDADSALVHDPDSRLDAHFFQSLNSGRTRRSA